MNKILKVTAVPLVLLLWLVIEIESLLISTLYLFRCDLNNAKSEIYWESPQSFISEWFNESSKWW